MPTADKVLHAANGPVDSQYDETIWVKSRHPLHPAPQASTAEDDLLAVLVDDLGAGNFQVCHVEKMRGETSKRVSQRERERPPSSRIYISVSMRSLQPRPHRTTVVAGATRCDRGFSENAAHLRLNGAQLCQMVRTVLDKYTKLPAIVCL